MGCKEAHMRNIMDVIDRGMFRKYVHVYKQSFFCDNRKPLQSIDSSFASFSPFYKGVEEKGKERTWCNG